MIIMFIIAKRATITPSLRPPHLPGFHHTQDLPEQLYNVLLPTPLAPLFFCFLLLSLSHSLFSFLGASPLAALGPDSSVVGSLLQEGIGLWTNSTFLPCVTSPPYSFSFLSSACVYLFFARPYPVSFIVTCFYHSGTQYASPHSSSQPSSLYFLSLSSGPPPGATLL